MNGRAIVRLPVEERLRASLQLLKAFVARHPRAQIRSKTRFQGFHLGQWVNNRRVEYRRGELPRWLVRELESVPGWKWDPCLNDHPRKARLLRQYVRRHGWKGFSRNATVQGVRIGHWVYNRMRAFAAGRLPDEVRKELEQIPGWTWTFSSNGVQEKEAVKALRRFIGKHGWGKFCSVTVVDGIQIGRFVTRRRTACAAIRMTWSREVRRRRRYDSTRVPWDGACGVEPVDTAKRATLGVSAG